MHSLDSEMNQKTLSRYLLDLGRLLREQALEAKQEARVATDLDKAFKRGKLFAYHEVVSLMQQQATVFQLPLNAIGLEGLDPETDLL